MSVQADDLSSRLDWSLVPFGLAMLAACLFYTFAQAFWVTHPGFTLNTEWVVIQVDRCDANPEWCETNPGHLQIGDQLTALEDLTYEDYERDRLRSPLAGRQPGDLVPIALIRDGREQTIVWEMPPVPAARRAESLVGLLFYLPFWLAGTVVLLFLRPRGVQWALLVASNYMTALWIAAGIVSQTYVAASSLVMHSLTWLMLPVYLHLHLLVPTPILLQRSERWLLLLYVGAIILLALELFQLLPVHAYMLGFGLAVLGSLGLLLYRLRAKEGRAFRATTGLMLAGIGLALAPGLVLNLAVILVDPAASSVAAIAAALVAVPILPMTYTYAIYRRRMGALEFRAHRLLSTYAFALLYGTVFAIVLLVGERLFGSGDGGIASSNGRSIVAVLLISMVFVLSAPALRFRFQRALNRMIHGIEYDADQVIHYFTSRIAAAVEREALIRLLSYQLCPSLLIRQWALYWLPGGGVELLHARGVDLEETPATDSAMRELLSRTGEYWLPPVDAPHVPSWVRLAIPLRLGNEVVGLWLFGARDPDDCYARDDVQLLGTLASQVAVSVENILLYEQAQQEIARRTQIEASLRRERDASQRYLDVSGVIILACDPNGEISLLNRRGYEILGYEPGELDGQNWFDVCLPVRVQSELRHNFERLLRDEEGAMWVYERPIRTKQRRERIIAWRNTLVRDEQGTVVGTLSSGQDVTSRVLAEEMRTRLVSAVEQAGEAIVIIDDEGRVRYVNDAFEKLTGYTRDEVLGQSPQMLDRGAGGSSFYKLIWERLSRGEAWSGYLTASRKDGTPYEAKVSISPVEDASRQVTEYLIVQRDATAEKVMEEQLGEAQAMRTMRQQPESHA